MKKPIFLVFLLILCVIPAISQTLVWNDEFNQPDGSVPDPTKWVFYEGLVNNQSAYFTSRPQNGQILNGNLVITALKETYTGPEGTRYYTSGYLQTKRLYAPTYGQFVARIKIPYGQGMWPAFWLLGDNIDEVGWPTCGEIDIFENIGKQPSTVWGHIHGPGEPKYGLGAYYNLPVGHHFSDAYHLFAVDWKSDSILFSVDNHVYKTITRSSLPSGAVWVFDHPFFIILQISVGGQWPGEPNGTTVWPQHMYVDYVRVYQ